MEAGEEPPAEEEVDEETKKMQARQKEAQARGRALTHLRKEYAQKVQTQLLEGSEKGTESQLDNIFGCVSEMLDRVEDIFCGQPDEGAWPIDHSEEGVAADAKLLMWRYGLPDPLFLREKFDWQFCEAVCGLFYTIRI